VYRIEIYFKKLTSPLLLAPNHLCILNNVLDSDYNRDVAVCSDNEWSAGIAFTEE